MKLEYLGLSDNEISVIGNSAFSGLTTLKVLLLDSNEISQIDVYSVHLGAHINLWNNVLLCSLEAIKAQHQTTQEKAYFMKWRIDSGKKYPSSADI